MTITAKMVKDLRDSTGAGMMDAKKALVETGGDYEAASDWLRQKIRSGVVVLGSVIDKKPVCVVMISDDLVDSGYDAVDLAKSIVCKVSVKVPT